jgi:hypothetical protein
MKTKRAVAALLGIGALGVIGVLGISRARAQDVAPPLVATGQFGLMGAIRGETVRLSITNINLATPPDPELPPPCRATLAFVDVDGDTLVRPDGTPVSRDVVLEAGHSAFLQVRPGAFLGKDETRLDLRPIIFVAPPDPTIQPDPCVPSLGIIDNATGQTRFLSAGASRTYSGNHNETLVLDR